MKRYKVTTEVSIIVYADDEEEAVNEMAQTLHEPDIFDDVSGYYEVEEVPD